MACPDENCFKSKEEMRDVLFKDKEGGVRYDIGRLKAVKVSWKALGIVCLIVLSLITVITSIQWHADASDMDWIKQTLTRIEVGE